MITLRTLRKWLGPAWLTQTGESGLVGYSFALVKDAFLQRAYLGLLAGYPQNDKNGATAPADALTLMGRDRKIVRGIFDTDATYAARLLLWLDDHRTRGNPFTLMRQLAGYCGPGVSFRTVDNSGNWRARDAAGVETSSGHLANWNWDGSAADWSRAWVIIYPGTLWSAHAAWGTGTWGAGTWGTTATQEQAVSLHAIVADWSPAGAQVEIIVALDAATFVPAAPEPDGTWGRFYRYATGTAVPSRLSTARFFGA